VQYVQSLATATGPVGYLLFNDHIATAEAALVAAVKTLAQLGVFDLVLDIRYNGGGYLDIASELAFMVAGPAATNGKTFDRITFNGKYPTTDPITGRPLAPTPFWSQTQGFSLPAGQALPSLNPNRVFVLTGNNTCSASEAIINSLRGVGVGVEVILIGAQTCGKPYGFYPQDNCGTTYFAIQFKGVNPLGFGDYADGFVAENATAPAG
jgi:carboxyl-terminal processing protease